MIDFDETTLDRWLADYDEFNYAFRRFCFENFRVHKISADFVPNVTRQIHHQWVSDHERWLNEETPESTKKLSHVKICALLLFNLNAESFLGNFYDHSYQDDHDYQFRGTNAEKEMARADLIDGREKVLALDFCVLIINWFEKNRTDRAVAYRQPMTVDMRHDLIGYLLEGSVDRKALYLILKAMFLRPSKGGKAN